MAIEDLIPGVSLLKTIGICAVACGVALGVGEWHGRAVASANAEARAAQATIRQLKERGLINEAVKNVPDCDLVRELGGVCGNAGQ